MASEDEGDEPMASRFDPDRPISNPASSPLSKPQGGARILSFLLQATVMAIALSLFFLFAGVAAIILLHLFVACRALRLRRRRLHYPFLFPSAAINDGVSGLSPEDLKSLPFFSYSGLTAAAADCAVCLEGFREGDRCRKLPGCNHSFHMVCVDRWLVKSPACPICRGVVAVVVPDPTAGRLPAVCV